MLSSRTRSELEQSLLAYQRERGHQVVVHTTASLEGLTIEDYSLQVAEQWKVGHKGLDNGVILIVAPNERKVRIEVGYGLEGVIPDAIANRIVQEVILPEFRAGGLESGIVAGTGSILQAAAGEYAPPRPERRSERRRSSPLFSLIWIVILLMAFGSRGLFFLPFMLGGGRGFRSGGFGGGGGGFGGGGFSGGGGGFGGGGASGGW